MTLEAFHYVTNLVIKGDQLFHYTKYILKKFLQLSQKIRPFGTRISEEKCTNIASMSELLQFFKLCPALL